DSSGVYVAVVYIGGTREGKHARTAGMQGQSADSIREAAMGCPPELAVSFASGARGKGKR
ncbi:hypothetical protein BIFBRE_05102, partial [Bifidobacterium breve DSM 20213 = JCM 1192]